MFKSLLCMYGAVKSFFRNLLFYVINDIACLIYRQIYEVKWHYALVRHLELIGGRCKWMRGVKTASPQILHSLGKYKIHVSRGLCILSKLKLQSIYFWSNISEFQFFNWCELRFSCCVHLTKDVKKLHTIYMWELHDT